MTLDTPVKCTQTPAAIDLSNARNKFLGAVTVGSNARIDAKGLTCQTPPLSPLPNPDHQLCLPWFHIAVRWRS